MLIAATEVTFGAGAIEQIRSISKLLELDLEKLKKGEIIANRGPLGGFSRGIYGESCFFVRASLEIAGKALLHSSSLGPPASKTHMAREYNWPAAAKVWDSLTLNSTRREDRWLSERTWQLLLTSGADTELHLTANEIASFKEINRAARDGVPVQKRDASVNTFWRKVLQTRNDALASGGLSGVPSYFAGGIQIEARAEFNNLLKLAPSVAAHFRPLISGAPFWSVAASSSEVIPYWVADPVRGHTNIRAAFFATRKESPSWQVARCTYYVSDTYFMSLSFYELWPQDGGTLIWQTDFVSAPFRAFTGGLDRIFAGGQMINETAAIAKVFRAEIEKSR
jgi:hypothetical protein